MQRLSTTPPKTGRLLLLRHAQGSLGTDDYDRLSPLGWRQAQRLGERLRLNGQINQAVAVYRGSLRRHRETTEAFRLANPEHIDASLDEYTVDRLIGAALDQAHSLGLDVPASDAFEHPQAYLNAFLEWFPSVLAHWQSNALVCGHNGTWGQFQSRVTRPLPLWREAVSAGHTVMAVTSAGVISTIVADALGEPLSWQRECNVRLYNASVTELRWTGSDWELVKLNCIQHLPMVAEQTLA